MKGHEGLSGIGILPKDPMAAESSIAVVPFGSGANELKTAKVVV